jgi:hypothetical protein
MVFHSCGRIEPLLKTKILLVRVILVTAGALWSFGPLSTTLVLSLIHIFVLEDATLAAPFIDAISDVLELLIAAEARALSHILSGLLSVGLLSRFLKLRRVGKDLANATISACSREDIHKLNFFIVPVAGACHICLLKVSHILDWIQVKLALVLECLIVCVDVFGLISRIGKSLTE